jgi:hypothetical protein
MSNDKSKTRVVVKELFLSWGMVLLFSGFCAGQSELSSITVDVLYQKDGLTSDYDWPVYAKGDYNGDGYKDMVMKWMRSPSYWKALVIPGGANLSGGNAEERSVMTLSMPGYIYPGFNSADLDNDGFDDIILSITSFPNAQSHQRVEVYYGQNPLRPTIEIGTTTPDWKIVTQSISAPLDFGVVAGDVTGDGNTDLLIASPNIISEKGEVYFIPGIGVRRTGVFDVSSEPGVTTFRGSPGARLGTQLLTGDFNKDGKRDILFSVWTGPPGREEAGMAYVVFGSSAFPAVWDFSTRPPDIAVWGDTRQVFPALAKDFDGDGLDELYVLGTYTDPMDNDQRINVLIPGTSFNVGSSVIDLRKSSPNFRPVVEVGKFSFLNINGMGTGDFDGDGRGDLVGPSFPPTTTPLWLSNDLQTLSLPTWSTASFVVSNILGNTPGSSLGDVNGDGFDDLVMTEQGSTGTFWGLVIYGFHPLDNPTIRFRERGLSPAERNVDFSVEGHPTEMKLEGQGNPLLMDRWLPYQPSLRLSLLPGTGTRSVSVTFRNRFGRFSATAQDTVTLGVEGPGTRLLTTVLRRGGAPIRIEGQLVTAGRLKVWVLDRRGETIATLVDDERGAGLWPVEWDGRNSAGEPVAPGIYVLFIETPHGLEKKPIVIK